MDQPVIEDEKPRTLGPASDMQEIGLSFPMFEMTEQDARESIAMGGMEKTQTADRWIFHGDGGQPTVEVQRLSSTDDPELRVRVVIGGLPPEVRKWEGTYLRQKNGWLNLKPKAEVAQ